ncbi:hypothetical protein, partial [Fusicatenibacter faecihominis]
LKRYLMTQPPITEFLRRPLELPHRARFRKYGAYVIQGLREMTGGLCIMVKNDVLFRVVGL